MYTFIFHILTIYLVLNQEGLSWTPCILYAGLEETSILNRSSGFFVFCFIAIGFHLVECLIVLHVK